MSSPFSINFWMYNRGITLSPKGFCIIPVEKRKYLEKIELNIIIEFKKITLGKNRFIYLQLSHSSLVSGKGVGNSSLLCEGTVAVFSFSAKLVGVDIFGQAFEEFVVGGGIWFCSRTSFV